MDFTRQTNIPLALVVAMSKNNVIGKGGTMPWRMSDDLKWFKKNTLGKPIIMGRKTFQSIGRPLPDRDNIVITRQSDFCHEDITVAGDLEDAIAIAEAFALHRGVQEICIIGGGEIYRQSLPFASRIYLTEIDTDIEGDVFFPAFNEEEWQRESKGTISKNDKNDYDARLSILTRKAD
jgi:dihydrofolate reductase